MGFVSRLKCIFGISPKPASHRLRRTNAEADRADRAETDAKRIERIKLRRDKKSRDRLMK